MSASGRERHTFYAPAQFDDETIDRHPQATIAPTPQQLQTIANFQRTDNRFFSRKALKSFAQSGPAPDLPQGHTASEKRGREFFVDAPWNPPSTRRTPRSGRGGEVYRRSAALLTQLSATHQRPHEILSIKEEGALA